MKRSLKRTGFILLLVSVFILSACQNLFGSPDATLTPEAMNSTPTHTMAPSSTPLPTSTASAASTSLPTLAVTASGPASCAPAPILPVISEEDQMIPDPSEMDWSFGPEDARLTLIEYSDFQCQICAFLAMNLRNLQVLYPEEVRVVFRYLPLTAEHAKANLAAQAAEAAGLQDKYWEMHDLLFTKQVDWTPLSEKDFLDWSADQAEELGLDKQQFSADLTSSKVVEKVINAAAESAKTTLTNPPALFFNKTLYQEWVDLSSLVNMVEYYKLPDKAFTECPKMTLDPNKQYTATFSTLYGDIVFQLYSKTAPMAVNNFIFLTRQKWYDNTTFYRVVPGLYVQGGDPSGSGNGRPGYLFTNEVTPNLRFNQPGMLAMSNYGDGTNGSQFFITYAAIPEFDGKYTIFGKVIKGMDVLASLRPRDPIYDQVLLPADQLISVTIEEE